MPFISIHGISADLLLLFVVSVSFQKGSRNGSLVGFLSGLLQDLATGTFFGINIFIKMIVGYVCGRFSKQVFKEQFFSDDSCCRFCERIQLCYLCVLYVYAWIQL
jgi:rod shape-determining protein MreD